MSTQNQPNTPANVTSPKPDNPKTDDMLSSPPTLAADSPNLAPQHRSSPSFGASTSPPVEPRDTPNAPSVSGPQVDPPLSSPLVLSGLGLAQDVLSTPTQSCSNPYTVRYSPPNDTAVSSTLASPSETSFSRPRYPLSVLHERSNSSLSNLIVQGVSSRDEERMYAEDVGSSTKISDRSLVNLKKDQTVLPTEPAHNNTEGEMVWPDYHQRSKIATQTEGFGSTGDEASDCFDFDHDDADDVMNNGRRNLYRRASSPTGRPLQRNPSIKFAPMSVQETPFSRTLTYFKQFRGKENSPSKSRRNASLPEEIAQLAHEAHIGEDTEYNEGGQGEEEWAKYRELDLAPIDPVMEDGVAGDLIMFTTPTQKGAGARIIDDDTKPLPPTLCETNKTDAAGIGQDLNVSGDNAHEKQLILFREDPVFVKVIGMLPEAMFWAVAQPIAHYGSKALGSMLEKLTSLTME